MSETRCSGAGYGGYGVSFQPVKEAAPWPEGRYPCARPKKSYDSNMSWDRPNRQITFSLNLSHTCLGEHLQQAKAAGIGWPFPADLDEEKFRQLMRATESPPSAPQRPLPPMEQVHRELQRKGVTLHLLWKEYRRLHPDGYRYTQFCEYYRRFCGQLEPALRQPHPAGERMFVDWAGMTVPLRDVNHVPLMCLSRCWEPATTPLPRPL